MQHCVAVNILYSRVGSQDLAFDVTWFNCVVVIPSSVDVCRHDRWIFIHITAVDLAD